MFVFSREIGQHRMVFISGVGVVGGCGGGGWGMGGMGKGGLHQ